MDFRSISYRPGPNIYLLSRCRRTASFSPFRERGRTITQTPLKGQIATATAFLFTAKMGHAERR